MPCQLQGAKVERLILFKRGEPEHLEPEQAFERLLVCEIRPPRQRVADLEPEEARDDDLDRAILD